LASYLLALPSWKGQRIVRASRDFSVARLKFSQSTLGPNPDFGRIDFQFTVFCLERVGEGFGIIADIFNLIDRSGGRQSSTRGTVLGKCGHHAELPLQLLTSVIKMCS